MTHYELLTGISGTGVSGQFSLSAGAIASVRVSTETEFISPTRYASLDKVPHVTEGEQDRNKQREPVSGTRRTATGLAALDRGVLDRMRLLLDDLDLKDDVQSTLSLDSLRCTCSRLWESAARASIQHQDVLALVESALLSWDTLSPNRVSVLKEALCDLSGRILTEAHVEVLRSRFVDGGWNPLSLLGKVDLDGDGATD